MNSLIVFIYMMISFFKMSRHFSSSSSDDETRDYYRRLEEDRVTEFNVPEFEDEENTAQKPLLKILAENIIENKDDEYLKILTNFNIEEFIEIYNVLKPVIELRTHKDAILSPKTKFLMTLIHLKHYESWQLLASNFNINHSYAYETVHAIITKGWPVLKEKYIKWISVSKRITNYNLRLKDFPLLIGSVDATVQRISKPKQNQGDYYSGKHKCHVMKVQAFVSPLGLLIHFTKSVPGSIHDFRLFKESDLVALINGENEKCNKIFKENCTTLGDSGYQGLSSVIPGGVTPVKKPKGRELNEREIAKNKTISKRRIIVENWFSRLKSLWGKMSQKMRNKKGTDVHEEYDMNWAFCASLTNYHISKHPLREKEPGVICEVFEEEDLFEDE